MNSPILKLLAACFLTFAPVAYAQPPKATGQAKGLKMLKEWQQKMVAGSDLSLRWQQVQFKALRGRYIRSNGQGFFSQPHRFVWDLQSSNQAWIYNGIRLYHLDRKTKKVIEYPATGIQNQEIRRFVGLITRFDRLTDKYAIKSFGESQSHLTFALTPKDSGDLTQVDVQYLKTKQSISQLKMIFSSGNTTTLTFSSQVRKKLPSATFALPSGVTIQGMP